MALIGRNSTGLGTKVETSLFVSGIWCNAVGVVSTQFDRKHLNPDPLNPSDPFSTYYLCADGKWLGMRVNEYRRDKEKLARLLGIEDILDDPRYVDIDSLRESGVLPDAVERISKIFLSHDSVYWRQLLSENSVSCEVMQSACEVSRDPQAIENRYLEEVEFTDGLKVMMPCPPVHFSSYGRKPCLPTGSIGNDTVQIFTELGYSREEIESMRKNGAIG